VIVLAVLVDGGPFGVVAAVVALAVALAVRPRGQSRPPAVSWIAVGCSVAGAALSVLPSAVTVLIAPYGWLSAIWSVYPPAPASARAGRPDGGTRGRSGVGGA
jgi:hypothetical protein